MPNNHMEILRIVIIYILGNVFVVNLTKTMNHETDGGFLFVLAAKKLE